jgi:hypothetical protein
MKNVLPSRPCLLALRVQDDNLTALSPAGGGKSPQTARKERIVERWLGWQIFCMYGASVEGRVVFRSMMNQGSFTRDDSFIYVSTAWCRSKTVDEI